MERGQERSNPLQELFPTSDNPLARVTGLPLKDKFGLVNSPDPTSRNNTDLHNLPAPRLGLAYRLLDKTVIRTGYGIFWLPSEIANTGPQSDPVNAHTTPFVGTTDGSLTPFNRLSNPFPSGIIQAPGHNANFQ